MLKSLILKILSCDLIFMTNSCSQKTVVVSYLQETASLYIPLLDKKIVAFDICGGWV